MTQMRFDGRVAVLTGAGRGLGRAYAELLAARGATVIVNDLAPDCVDRVEGASEPAVLETIRNSGGKAEIIYADLGAEPSSRDLAREAIDRFGRVDIFIHNAGTATGTLDHHLDLHLRGAVWAMHELWPGMVDREFGRVLITTSGVGLYGSGAGGHGPGTRAPLGSVRTGSTAWPRRPRSVSPGISLIVAAPPISMSTRSLRLPIPRRPGMRLAVRSRTRRGDFSGFASHVRLRGSPPSRPTWSTMTARSRARSGEPPEVTWRASSSPRRPGSAISTFRSKTCGTTSTGSARKRVTRSLAVPVSARTFWRWSAGGHRQSQ